MEIFTRLNYKIWVILDDFYLCNNIAWNIPFANDFLSFNIPDYGCAVTTTRYHPILVGAYIYTIDGHFMALK